MELAVLNQGSDTMTVRSQRTLQVGRSTPLKSKSRLRIGRYITASAISGKEIDNNE